MTLLQGSHLECKLRVGVGLNTPQAGSLLCLSLSLALYDSINRSERHHPLPL